MDWRPVNVQSPENRHYVQDHHISTKSLVLIRMQGDQQNELKVVNDTGELVGNKAAIEGYLAKNARLLEEDGMSGLQPSAIRVSAGTAFRLGALTSISPSLMAPNCAAISRIGRGLTAPHRVLAEGLLCTPDRSPPVAGRGG